MESGLAPRWPRAEVAFGRTSTTAPWEGRRIHTRTHLRSQSPPKLNETIFSLATLCGWSRKRIYFFGRLQPASGSVMDREGHGRKYGHAQFITPSVLNCRSFKFFYSKFDHSFYSKNCAKYYLFCYGLFYQYKIFKNNLNLAIFV